MPVAGETKAVKSKPCNARARLKARANSLKSGSINFVRRGSRRTVMKKYRGKGRRNLDTALHYNGLQHHGERKDADPLADRRSALPALRN
jgi:hypothetical protein